MALKDDVAAPPSDLLDSDGVVGTLVGVLRKDGRVDFLYDGGMGHEKAHLLGALIQKTALTNIATEAAENDEAQPRRVN